MFFTSDIPLNLFSPRGSKHEQGRVLDAAVIVMEDERHHNPEYFRPVEQSGWHPVVLHVKEDLPITVTPIKQPRCRALELQECTLLQLDSVYPARQPEEGWQQRPGRMRVTALPDDLRIP